MPRKRKTEQPTNTTESPEIPATAAVAEPPLPEEPAEKRSFADRFGKRENTNTLPDPFEIAGDYAAGIRLFDSRAEGLMILKFDERPSPTIIEKVKESRCRYNPTRKFWEHPYRRDTAMGTRIEFERLYQELRKMIRDEKGIDTSQEVPF